jgi:hypothetical protein
VDIKIADNDSKYLTIRALFSINGARSVFRAASSSGLSRALPDERYLPVVT